MPDSLVQLRAEMNAVPAIIIDRLQNETRPIAADEFQKIDSFIQPAFLI